MKPGGNGSGQVMNKVKQICKDTDKFQKKIAGKEFLLGKYFDGQKAMNKSKRMKKYTKSKVEKLLSIQEKIIGKEPRYELYEPLSNLWKSYITDLLKNDKTEDTIYLKLLRADFHGAHITVIHSKINSYIGLEGIIINESLKTFKIITQQHRILTLLKPEVVMQIRTADKFYALNGNCLVYRSIDRSKIKFKNRKPEEINLQFMGELLKDSDQIQ